MKGEGKGEGIYIEVSAGGLRASKYAATSTYEDMMIGAPHRKFVRNSRAASQSAMGSSPAIVADMQTIWLDVQEGGGRWGVGGTYGLYPGLSGQNEGIPQFGQTWYCCFHSPVPCS
jgi:hypothetical protein